MNGRSASALVAMLALVTTVFAGCVQPDWLNKSSMKTEISALADKDLADNAAKAWNEKAGLLSVFSMELGTNEGQDDIPLDATVGNGLAPVWFYVYCAMDSDKETQDDGGSASAGEAAQADSPRASAKAADEMAVFRVMADGHVVRENDSMGMASQMPSMQMHDITTWKVDSPAGLDAAKANKTFLASLEAPNASVAEGVAWIEGKSAWYFAAGGESGIAVAIVDAASGKLLEVRTMKLDMSNIPDYARPKSMPMAPPVHVEGKGTVDSATPKKEFPFMYDGGDTLAQLKMNAQGQTPMDGITWKLLDPAGKEIKAQAAKSSSGQQGRASGPVQYKLSESGDYKLVVQYAGFTSRMPLGAPLPIGSESFSFVLSNEMKAPEKPQ